MLKLARKSTPVTIWFRTALILAVVLLFLGPVCWAQLPQAGDTTSPPSPSAAQDYIHAPVETVNPANGSVSIRIPLRIPQGRELTIPLYIAYDSNGAFYVGESSSGQPAYLTSASSFSQGGWSYTLPAITDNIQTWTVTPGGGAKPYTCTANINYVFQDPTGNRHNLDMIGIERALGGQSCDSQATPGGEGPLLATLGNYATPVTVTDGDGTVYSLSGTTWTIEDRNGNTASVSMNLNTPSATVTDTLDRTAVSIPSFGSSPDDITVAGLSSEYQVYWTTVTPSFSDTMLDLDSSDPDDGGCPSSLSSTAKEVISKIVLPNGQEYTFSYNSTYGMLDEITYPSGGHVRYVWGLNSESEALNWTYLLSVGGKDYHCRYGFPVITDRYVSLDGSSEQLHQQFTYAPPQWNSGSYPNNLSWTSKQTTVTTTDNIQSTSFKTIYTYEPINAPIVPTELPPYDLGNPTAQMPYEQEVQYYDTSGILLKTVNEWWYSGGSYDTTLPTLSAVQTTLNSTGQSSLIAYCYNTYQEVTDKFEYDFGSGTPSLSSCVQGVSGEAAGALLRNTVTNYASFTGAHIVDSPSSVITYNGSGTRVAETDSSYDQATLVTFSPSPVQLTTAPGGSARGNLTTVTKQCFQGSTACSQGNSAMTYSYYNTGQAYQMTDACGNVPCADMPSGMGHTTTYSYTDNYASCSGNAPSGTTDAYLTGVTYPQTNGVNHIVSFCYDYKAGTLNGSTDENGQPTTYTYADDLDRLTHIVYPDTGQTLVYYNDTPPTPSVTVDNELNTAGQYVTNTTIYDGVGLPTETELTTDPVGTDYTLTVYDALGRVYEVTNPYHSTSDPTYGVTTYTYDALSRATSVQHPDGSTIQTAYNGRATEVTDEGNGTKSVQRVSQTDGLGRMVSVCEVSSATQLGTTPTPAACGQDISATGFLTTYQYDTLDDLVQVNQGGLNARTFSYDSLSQLVSSSNPESGLTTDTYDANGNIMTSTQPEENQTDASDTVTTTYLYDALNRMTAKEYSDDTSNVDYNYDETSPWGFTLTNPVGRLTTEYDGNTGSVFSYDPMGRVVQNHQCTPQNCGSADFPIAYTYDLLGDIASSTDGQYNLYTDTYNGAGRLTSLVSSYSDSNHPATLFSSAAYNAPGQLTSAQLGNGITETFGYNTRLETTSFAAGSVYNFSMGYTPDGDVASVNDGVNGNWTYGYDDFNRLSASSCSSHCPDGQNTQGFSYAYDRFGNRWQQNVTSGSGGTSSLTFSGDNNQIDGYSYDAAGNLMNDGSHTYYYDAEHHLVQEDGTEGWCASGTGTAATACYTYDAEGRRVRRAVPGSGVTDDYLYDLSGHFITQVSGQGTWVRGEIYAGGTHIATYENDLATPTTFFNHTDHLGTERVETAVNGTTCETITSLPFGDGLNTSGSCDPTELRFTGKERDWESNLDNFGARYNSSQLGRFMSADPDNAGASDDDPQTWNGYSYVRNSPLNAIDPDGRHCVSTDGGHTFHDDNSGGQTCAQVAADPSSYVTVNGDYTDDEQVQMLARAIAALTSARQFADVSRHGIEGAMTFDGLRGLLELPEALFGEAEGIEGLYGRVSRDALEAAANSGGPTVRVVTNLTQAPQAGRALSVAAGESADALANAARSGGRMYVANIPKALLDKMVQAGLATESITNMGGATAEEISFQPQATEFVVKYFHAIP